MPRRKTQAEPDRLHHHIIELFFKHTTRFFAVFVFLLLAAVMVSLVFGSWDAITSFGFSFLWSDDWNPVQERYGALIPIVGTLITSFLALLIAVPISFGIAIFLTELAPEWLRRPVGTAIEMLAAIPSIIYGMWGLFIFVPLFQEHIQPALIDWFGDLPIFSYLFAGAPFGIGLFTAGLVLAIMIIPFIASVMRDVFSIVPAILKESAYGLGSTTWEVMWKVVLPYTKTGVVGGIMLGLGRALGETMAVTFVIGNAFHLPESLFSPSTSIASAIANEFNEASGFQKSALMELGLILFLITTVVLSISRLLIMRIEKKEGRK
ncbi:phosphate ABC transporter permease subunit PstC [Pasteurella multocida]|uniref:phosphate ABC transporter permease subunit PstC n=1 Tax=Pasteurella multocida TaxID=747 RepID=UPI000DFA1FD0|nr:phosphate ABC transporter permease subunit PstC [Pasteurella multocida]QEU01316.1 phosphate ABC transporter permease subunit PstC [Pasteurella multocida]SUB41751.1 phosphate transport system permease protein PstC [Pasteurella multocida subsp. septica]HDR1062371.1 phosphate ABC transporter permease subunit PstC [Pasteurella multocida]HEA3275230.1 phosphate ABC transporter permease subunit PstC [Pasteurella multocida]